MRGWVAARLLDPSACFPPARADLANRSVVTRSFPRPTPEWVLEYRAGVLAARAGSDGAGDDGIRRGGKRATVKEECPKCKHPHMEFYTMQLRSADEGQTVFYECPAAECGHKFSVNT